VGRAVDPDDPVHTIHARRWGVVNSTIFALTGLDGPNWLNDRWLALSMAMLTHIWSRCRSGR
jgi:ABC-type sugar transport system permease subunit